MPQIIIHLTDLEYKKVQKAMQHNGKNDLENETLSGTEIKISMSPFGHFLEISGHQSVDIDNVVVEIVMSEIIKRP